MSSTGFDNNQAVSLRVNSLHHLTCSNLPQGRVCNEGNDDDDDSVLNMFIRQLTILNNRKAQKRE